MRVVDTRNHGHGLWVEPTWAPYDGRCGSECRVGEFACGLEDGHEGQHMGAAGASRQSWDETICLVYGVPGARRPMTPVASLPGLAIDLGANTGRVVCADCPFEPDRSSDAAAYRALAEHRRDAHEDEPAAWWEHWL